MTQRDDRIIELFNAGMSMGLIGQELGCTRNAVAGQLFRLRQQGRRQVRPVQVRPVQVRSAIGVEYLLNDGCKAILDKRGEWDLPLCCGQPRDVDALGRPRPYCPRHVRIFCGP